MKTDHKSSPCHYVTGELKKRTTAHRKTSDVIAMIKYLCYVMSHPSIWSLFLKYENALFNG